MSWTIEQQQKAIELSHLEYASKFASSPPEATEQATFSNSGSVVTPANVICYVNLQKTSDATNLLRSIEERFVGVPWTIFLTPQSKPTGIVEVLSSAELPISGGKLKTVPLHPLTLDTVESKYFVSNFSSDHPASRLTFREVSSGPELDDFVQVTFKTLLNGGRAASDVLMRRIRDAYSGIARNTDPVFKTFVAYEDDKPAACASVLMSSTSNTAGIYEMGVLPEFRGKGYGHRMFGHVCEVALAAGYTRLVLYATDMAKPIYEKAGFKVVDGGQFYRLNFVPNPSL